MYFTLHAVPLRLAFVIARKIVVNYTSTSGLCGLHRQGRAAYLVNMGLLWMSCVMELPWKKFVKFWCTLPPYDSFKTCPPHLCHFVWRPDYFTENVLVKSSWCVFFLSLPGSFALEQTEAAFRLTQNHPLTMSVVRSLKEPPGCVEYRASCTSSKEILGGLRDRGLPVFLQQIRVRKKGKECC